MSKRNAGASTGTRRRKRPTRRRAVRRRVAAPEDTTAREVADALLAGVLNKTTGVIVVPAPPLAPWLQTLMSDPDKWARGVAEAMMAAKKRRGKK